MIHHLGLRKIQTGVDIFYKFYIICKNIENMHRKIANYDT